VLATVGVQKEKWLGVTIVRVAMEKVLFGGGEGRKKQTL
jgi:hypothetical protein